MAILGGLEVEFGWCNGVANIGFCVLPLLAIAAPFLRHGRRLVPINKVLMGLKVQNVVVFQVQRIHSIVGMSLISGQSALVTTLTIVHHCKPNGT